MNKERGPTRPEHRHRMEVFFREAVLRLAVSGDS